MTTVEQQPVIWRHDAELEQHFEESEWCHLYRPLSNDVSLCGFHGMQHTPVPWEHTDVCPWCNKRTCVDCIRILESIGKENG